MAVGLMGRLHIYEERTGRCLSYCMMGIVIIKLPNLQYPFELHMKWPLLCLMLRCIQSRILKR